MSTPILAFAIPKPILLFFHECVWEDLLNGFCVPLALPAVLVFLYLVLFHRLGITLGLPRLFWLPSRNAQFMVGLGIGAVAWQLFLAGYVFEEFATNFTIDRPPFCEIRKPYEAATPVDVPGFPGRFRYDPASVWSMWRYAGAVAGAAGVLVAAIAAIVWLLQAIGQQLRWWFYGWKPYVRTVPEPRVHYAAWLPFGMAAGWLAATGLTALFIAVSFSGTIGEELVEHAGWGQAAKRQAEVRANIDAWRAKAADARIDPFAMARAESSDGSRRPWSWYQPYTPVYGAFTLNFCLIFVVSVVMIAVPQLRPFSPAVGIVLILNIIVYGAILLSVFAPLHVSGNFVLAVLVVIVILAGRSYKFRFPNLPPTTPLSLEKRYQELCEIEAGVASPSEEEAAAQKIFAAAPEMKPIFSHRIPYPHNGAWNGAKPPLAIVSLSGGGSRAAAWAMQVLAALEERFLKPGKDRPAMALPYHTRLITGASGGMLAGAYYAASLAAPDGNRAVNRNSLPITLGSGRPLTTADLLDGVRQDLLTPITHELVSHDLPALFLARHFTHDRGQAFEDALRTALREQLHVPFTALREGEAEGWRPSLIFSPMLVEDGRQLFISNLDLRKVTQNRAFILGEEDSPSDPSGFGLLSREGIEFFKLFPDATGFTVATAARMSASFPYVLPGVPLPTNPPRRVVDAGYYDNFGIGIAASWLFNHMDWVREHASGVVLIQIRDGVSEAGRKREAVLDSFPTLIDRGLQWLTTPPDGLWNSRMASNAFRNDNLLHLLNDFFIAQGFARGFFATVAFEFPQGDDVALNFTLSADEIAAVENAATSPAFTARVESLLNWWHQRMAAPHAAMSLAEVNRPGPPSA